MIVGSGITTTWGGRVVWTSHAGEQASWICGWPKKKKVK